MLTEPSSTSPFLTPIHPPATTSTRPIPTPPATGPHPRSSRQPHLLNLRGDGKSSFSFSGTPDSSHNYARSNVLSHEHQDDQSIAGSTRAHRNLFFQGWLHPVCFDRLSLVRGRFLSRSRVFLRGSRLTKKRPPVLSGDCNSLSHQRTIGNNPPKKSAGFALGLQLRV